MIKIAVVSLWMAAVALGSAYATVAIHVERGKAGADGGAKGGLEHIKTRMISVPVIVSGNIEGYVIAQFGFNVQAGALKKMTIKPDALLVDEAFRALYGGNPVDMRNPRKSDFPALAKRITESVNKRLGTDLVQDVVFHEINYVPKGQARRGDVPARGENKK